MDSLSGTADPGPGPQESHDTGEVVVEDPLDRIEAGDWTVTVTD